MNISYQIKRKGCGHTTLPRKLSLSCISQNKVSFQVYYICSCQLLQAISLKRNHKVLPHYLIVHIHKSYLWAELNITTMLSSLFRDHICKRFILLDLLFYSNRLHRSLIELTIQFHRYLPTKQSYTHSSITSLQTKLNSSWKAVTISQLY